MWCAVQTNTPLSFFASSWSDSIIFRDDQCENMLHVFGRFLLYVEPLASFLSTQNTTNHKENENLVRNSTLCSYFLLKHLFLFYFSSGLSLSHFFPCTPFQLRGEAQMIVWSRWTMVMELFRKRAINLIPNYIYHFFVIRNYYITSNKI